jgi:hypothetical protein
MTDLDEFARKCALWNDAYLLEEFEKGPAAYAQADYFTVIQTEVTRRGLSLQLTPTVSEPPSQPPQGPYARRLWRGEIPLPETYWIWGVACNLIQVIVVQVLKPPPLIDFILFPFLIAYRVFIWVAIWRSSGHYAGPRYWAGLARVAVVGGIVMVLLIFFRLLVTFT